MEPPLEARMIHRAKHVDFISENGLFDGQSNVCEGGMMVYDVGTLGPEDLLDALRVSYVFLIELRFSREIVLRSS
mgnify:CR=1 FL=1